MVTMLRPGVPTAIFSRVIGETKIRGRMALTPLAEGIKRQAKINASNGRHRYGTKTPAYPGTGPAIISKTLVNSIDRSPVVRISRGWMCMVGTTPNRYPQTYRSHKSSAEYGYILEVVGTRNGNLYPFLYPAFRFGVDYLATVIFVQKYGYTWARIE